MSQKDAQELRLASLMRRSLDGDEAAYRELLRDTAQLIRRYVVRRLPQQHSSNADDLVQDTLMAIHSRRMTYDPARPYGAWVHAIAHYKLVDHFRRSRVRVAVSLDDVAEFLGVSEEAALDARMDVTALLQSLPERSRALIHGVKIEGRSVADVAVAAGMSETSVKVSIHRGLRAIAARLRGADDDR